MTLLVQLLDALLERDAARLLALADAMAERSLSFAQALRDLASLLHRIPDRRRRPGWMKIWTGPRSCRS